MAQTYASPVSAIVTETRTEPTTADGLQAVGIIVLSIGFGAIWWPLGLIVGGALIFAVATVASRAGK